MKEGNINNNAELARKIRERIDEIKRLYLSDNRPWIIGYSGGKDSSTALQLVWHALSELSVEERNRNKKQVYVITTDTLVENPIITNYVTNTLGLISKTAKEKEMPFTTKILYPDIEETFWVNLIGRGYPAPWPNFRWCTDRLKIRPSNRFILEHVSKEGEVILVLGIRENESMTRAQAMKLHKIKNGTTNSLINNLYRHDTLAGTLVYAPIRDWSVDDVWAFLLQYSTDPPWDTINNQLVTIYKRASDPLSDECPLVVDNTTPSCGGSRFGCWVCTVVKKDKSMESLIEHGEEWMVPLLELRELLYSTQDPDMKPVIREPKRRAGHISFKNDGSGRIIYGPYKLEFCKEILKRVLTIQEELRRAGHNNSNGNNSNNITLIRDEELQVIRRIWRNERGDWEDSLPRIYREITGREFEWGEMDDGDRGGIFGKYEAAILQEITKKTGVQFDLIRKLIDVELMVQGLSKRVGIYGKLEEILDEEWRDIDEITRQYKEDIEWSDQL